MKKFINRPRYIFTALLIIGAGVFVAMQSHYQHKVSALEAEVTELEEKNITYRDAMKYTQNNEEEKIGKVSFSNYKQWQKAQKLANQFVEQSDGKFKKEWGLFLISKAKQYEIDPYIVYELIRVETGDTFDPKLKGPKTQYGHAYGLSQFMKNTAPWIADMAGIEYKDDLLYNPYYSIQLSVVYLDFLHERYEGDWDQALTAYHRGIYGLENYVKENGHAKSWYAKRIQNKAKKQEQLVAYNQ
ncbi:transglycosylase SLT domain-containing protein [Bacillus tianshenii]|nr:transglycosylase SLT domain-containing protein [Bacillus tianshenii]